MVNNTVPSHLRRMSPPPPGLPATLSRGTRAPPTPRLATALSQRSQTYLARLGSRSPELSQSLRQGSAHVASTVAKAIGGRRIPIARMRDCFDLCYH